MDNQTLENFIDFGSNQENTPQQLRSGLIAIDILALISSVFGVLYNQKTLIYSIVLYLIVLIALPYLLYVTNPKTFNLLKRIKFQAINSVCTTVLFLLISLIFFTMIEPPILSTIVLCLLPLFMSGLYFFITIFNLNKLKYKHKKNIQKTNFKNYATMGSIAGFWIARSCLNGLTQDETMLIVAIIAIFLSCVFSFGTINFLKIYLLKQLSKKQGTVSGQSDDGSMIDKTNFIME